MDNLICDRYEYSNQRINKPLISVIVPIFNVEKYLRKCLDSLNNQTLKQIEVICVDDGSTDRSGKIADEYESCNWPRFITIHTENRGLSAARNLGVDESIADYLMFVDSDDWVETEFCRLPYEASQSNTADLVIFNTNKEELVDEFTAHEYGGVAVWNKLYHRRLFEGVRYPEGRVFEDSATTHKLVHNADRIVFLQDFLYHYRSRKGSISHTYSRANKRDRMSSEMERYGNLLLYGVPREKAGERLASAAIGYLVSTKDENDNLYAVAKDIVDRTKEIPKNIKWKQRLAWKTWKYNKRLFYLLGRVTGRLKA